MSPPDNSLLELLLLVAAGCLVLLTVLIGVLVSQVNTLTRLLRRVLTPPLPPPIPAVCFPAPVVPHHSPRLSRSPGSPAANPLPSQ